MRADTCRLVTLDAVASGLNMLSEELEANVVERVSLEKAITALEAANSDLGAFSDVLAHDLKTPLLTVTNFSHYLRESIGASLNEEDADYLERIQVAGRLMMHLIDDLRNLADVKGAEISRSEIDLSALGREIMDDLIALAPDRDVRFEAAPEIRTNADKTLVRILLTNLLQNAWKYSGRSDDPWIELGVAEDDGDVPVYHVRDNGIGFDNADNQEIFQAFKRLHTKEEFEGTGLGPSSASL
jgi:light-regulated signal transduction histidine kinase (bacteriophytochrome)